MALPFYFCSQLQRGKSKWPLPHFYRTFYKQMILNKSFIIKIYMKKSISPLSFFFYYVINSSAFQLIFVKYKIWVDFFVIKFELTLTNLQMSSKQRKILRCCCKIMGVWFFFFSLPHFCNITKLMILLSVFPKLISSLINLHSATRITT